MPAPVRVWTEEVVLPTYLPAPPDRHPMFLDRRVYQGSSGRVYPLPFTDRIAEEPVDRRWRAVWMENEFLRVLILPELGGRIHALQDRTNGYDLIYRQPVIKPALVGLAGPWISGGIEFNWPQHHRPATFLPVDLAIEEAADGSRVVWLGDRDPLTRLSGRHGVCLHPGRSCLELKVRVSNRTPFVQTFLWWANVATQVHEGYQSFFPPDVRYVADHAKRATTRFPLSDRPYYGVDYPGRARSGVPKDEVPGRYVPPHCRSRAVARGLGRRLPAYRPDDLSWYANIPTPCSYMAMGSRQDFFGGYDHYAGAGLVHLADHHIAPGKKQWTWGNHEFGYAWDRNLTEAREDGEYPPYIELMAGVFTDNQPDFSFLHPGETRCWSQYWYPIRQIGPPRHATLDAAVNLQRTSGGLRLGINVTRAIPDATVCLEHRRRVRRWKVDLAPGRPWLRTIGGRGGALGLRDTIVRLLDRSGAEVIVYRAAEPAAGPVPPPATEPPAPTKVSSLDQLYLIGVHLDQYRHATRCPTPYWEEGLRRDPGDARCHHALGLWRLRRGEFSAAESHFRQTIARLTERNPNPRDGEPFYSLGVCLRFQGRDPEAAEAFHKARWNRAWAGPAGFHLAGIAGSRGDWREAAGFFEQVLELQPDHPGVRHLLGRVLRRLGRHRQARAVFAAGRAADPLDAGVRQAMGETLEVDLQTRLDLAHECAWAGLLEEALGFLEAPRPERRDLPDQNLGAEPIVGYTCAWLLERLGRRRESRDFRCQAAAAAPDYCHPARLEEIVVLEAAIRAGPRDARAPYYLGNLLYDRRRHLEAIRCWERAVALDPGHSVAWRNLGMAYFNGLRRPARARRAYDAAVQADPGDARLRYERDQLWKRLGVSPARRIRALESHLDLVRQRDDLSVEWCALLNQVGRHAEALSVLKGRRFQPWEGGEGQVLGQYARTRAALGWVALGEGHGQLAADHFRAALEPPENLGEARHLLANASDLYYGLGCALAASGRRSAARQAWRRAVRARGDFQEMEVRSFSEMTYHSARAWEALGQGDRAEGLLRELLAYARARRRKPAVIDYFATSLPNLLLFEDDLQARQETTSLFLEAQACLGLGRRRRARALLRTVLDRDPNHAFATDLWRAAGSWASVARLPVVD